MNPMQQNKTDNSQVVIVEASAGSGKTYTLAKRYLQILMQHPHGDIGLGIRNILAITFTNRATLEMKQRILNYLKKISFDAFEDDSRKNDILAAINMSGPEARNKAALIVDRMIDNYTFFQVQTIDSFVNNLLLGCAFAIERSGQFRIRKDYTNYLSYCFDRILEEASQQDKVKEILYEFLDHYLLVDNQTGWFPKAKMLDLMRWLFNLYNGYLQPLTVHQQNSMKVIKLKKEIFKQLAKINKELPEGMNARSKKQINDFIEQESDLFDIKKIPSVLAREDVPMNKGRKADKGFVQSWQKLRRKIKKLVETDSIYAYNPYLKVFRFIIEIFNDISRKENILFLQELNKKACLVTGEDGLAVEELYYRLATRYHHYLIDEFQDTSILQWSNLEEMVREALSTGGSLFYVGDKKQAIYSFRGGQTELFDSISKELSYFGTSLVYLNKNWRSQKEIVIFNNNIFSPDNLRRVLLSWQNRDKLKVENKYWQEVIDVFKDSQQQYVEDNDSGYVEVVSVDEDSKADREAAIKDKLINLLDSLAKRFNYQDVAVLVSDNVQVELITSWLLEEGYPVESEKTLNILENSLIKEILSFLRFLYSPIDNISFSSFILGDIFSTASNRPQQELHDFIFANNQQGEQSFIYKAFREQYPDLWRAHIEDFFQSVGFVSLYELVTSIYQHFDVFNKFPQQHGFLMKFLEFIKTNEEDWVSFQDFINYLENPSLEDLYVFTPGQNSTKVLTVHKAKGLEFEVVVLPFLQVDITPAQGGRNSASYLLKEDSLDLMRITKQHRLFSSILQDKYLKSYRQACIDELNKLYVAFTRPKKELYIFIPSKNGNKANKAVDLIPACWKKLGETKDYQCRKNSVQDDFLDIEKFNLTNWLNLVKDEFGSIEKVVNRRRIQEGNVMHSALSMVGNIYNQNQEEIIEEIIRGVKNIYPNYTDFDFLKSKLSEVFNSPNLRPFFSVKDAEVYREKEVVNKQGDSKRIDRLILTNNQAWVVDYKSSRSYRQQHKSQLQEYVAIIKNIFPARVVNGYLVYLDNLIVDEVSGAGSN
jgi:ATP-dependent exoDNAse (exonuclease V) beta subunit